MIIIIAYTLRDTGLSLLSIFCWQCYFHTLIHALCSCNKYGRNMQVKRWWGDIMGEQWKAVAVPCSERRPWYHQSRPYLTAGHLLAVSGPACLQRTQWSNSPGEKRHSVLRQQPLQSIQRWLYVVRMTSTSAVFVCGLECVCAHTTLGSRLFWRSGMRVWVRMYTAKDMESQG